MSLANPVVAPSSTNTWIRGLKWGEYWDSPGPGTNIIYYAIAGNTTVDFGGVPVFAFQPYAEEVAAIEDILQNIENIIDVDFVATADLAFADIVFASVSDADAEGSLGSSLPPGYYFNSTINDWQSVAIVNRDAYSMNGSIPDGLNPGGYDYITWLHELGHNLGLAHPHDNGGTSTIFPGVRSAFNSYGTYSMNQGIFTTMTYNDGWVAGAGARGSSGGAQYGWQSTMMALDVATLQFLYGTNPSFANGDNSYVLGDANIVGTGYQSIWDTGGTDTMVYNGSRNVTLDLRAATLASAIGGGGFMSYVISGGVVFSAFTIASGVVIENANGGNGNDNLIGNTADNALDGGSGGDSMTGGNGNDTYYVDNILDTIVELANGGLDIVHAAINWILALNVENLQLEDTALTATGNSSVNALYGTDGANILDGKAGADLLYGYDGDDTYVVDASGDQTFENTGEGTDTVTSSVSYTLGENVENLTLTGSSAINGTGNAIANVIIGNSGNNILAGLGGTDTLIGGAGTDTASYTVSALAVSVSLMNGTAGGGDAAGDTFSGIENLTGSTLDDTLEGNGGNNVLAGGVGIDTVSYEHALAGVKVSLATTSSQNTTGAGSDTLTGFENLTGSAFNDTLTGSTGNNVLTGLAGNDIYVVGNAGDVVDEASGSGTDLVQAVASFDLSTVLGNVENLTLTGSGAINGTGNALINTITGNSGANIIEGKEGADVLDGSSGLDTVSYASSADGVTVILNGATATFGVGGDAEGDSIRNFENIAGSAAGDNLTGNSAANVIDGGAGADTMTGGAGNDTYVVDDGLDVIVEATTGGTDLVRSAIAYSLLGTNLENLTLLGFDNINATGNALANILTGNSFNNRLDGGAGTDTMIGGLGDDTYVVSVAADKVTELVGQGTDTIETALAGFSLAALTAVENLTYTGVANFTGTGNALANTIIGGVLNDVLNGGAAADTLIGGAGNDTYVVDNILDTVSEFFDSGNDLVQSSVNFILSADVERLTLTGTGAVNGTGNALINTITGNGGVNIIEGKEGADILDGGSGLDTVSYASSAEGVTVILNGATATFGVGGDAEGDSIRNFENITGSATGDSLTGNGSANAINGGFGADVLTGGAGNDNFVFSSFLDPGNIDTITDFSAPSDTIRLDDAIFAALITGNLSSAAFRIGGAAADASDRIIYDNATGAVYYDADGNGTGAAQQFALLNTGLILTNADFFIF